MCHICGRDDFTSMGALNLHIKRHTKPYTCAVCGQGFSEKMKLRAHRYIHTGETPFVCAVCAKGFRNIYHFRAHMKNSHSGVLYQCEECQIMFKHKQNLYTHMKKKHGVTELELVTFTAAGECDVNGVVQTS